MKLPLQISFRGMDSSPALERRIRDKVAKLERLHDRLMSCAVVVDARTRRQHKGKVYRIGIDLRGPGFEIAVGKAAGVIPRTRTSQWPSAMRSMRSAVSSRTVRASRVAM